MCVYGTGGCVCVTIVDHGVEVYIPPSGPFPRSFLESQGSSLCTDGRVLGRLGSFERNMGDDWYTGRKRNSGPCPYLQ